MDNPIRTIAGLLDTPTERPLLYRVQVLTPDKHGNLRLDRRFKVETDSRHFAEVALRTICDNELVRWGFLSRYNEEDECYYVDGPEVKGRLHPDWGKA